MRFRNEAEEAQDEEHDAQTAQAVEVECPAPDPESHEEPGAKDTNHVHSVLPQRKTVGAIRVQAGLLEEISRVVGEGVTAEVLDCPHHAHNLEQVSVLKGDERKELGSKRVRGLTSVLRRSCLLKQSRYEAPVVACSSSAVV